MVETNEEKVKDITRATGFNPEHYANGVFYRFGRLLDIVEL